MPLLVVKFAATFEKMLTDKKVPEEVKEEIRDLMPKVWVHMFA